MEPIHKPTKEQVRQYMARRRTERTPPPTTEEIRRQLGFGLTSTPKR